MSEQQPTYESVLELIRENSREFTRSLKEQGAEFDRLMKNQSAAFRQEMQERDAEYDKMRQETDRRMKETDKKISALGSRIGEIVENMLGGRILDKF